MLINVLFKHQVLKLQFLFILHIFSSSIDLPQSQRYEKVEEIWNQLPELNKLISGKLFEGFVKLILHKNITMVAFLFHKIGNIN